MRRTYLVLLLIAGYNLTVSYQNPFSIKHIKGTFVTVSKDTTQIFFTPVIADSIPEGVLLDEVVLTGSNHEFDSALYNQELNQQLQWDIINNPYAYEKNIPSGNLFALLGLAIKLFERRKPSLKKGLIKDSDLETLYQEEDNFLNDSFF